jgi:predicted outer membrane repeat protein
MRALRVLSPFVFGVVITFGVLLGVARASGEPSSPASPSGDIIYVDYYNEYGAENGESWATAYTDLQDALAEAESGDQIWVGRGWYKPGSNRGDTFNLVPGVALYGGFDPDKGADELSERDWDAYPTNLTGYISGGDNCYHVVTADGTSTPITDDTMLDGFIIRYGQANGVDANQRGGGFYCDGSNGGECSPTLANLTFTENYAEVGGAIHNFGNFGNSSPSLTNVTFSNNTAGLNGGAMANNSFFGDSSPKLTDVTFSGNSASDKGGAIFNRGWKGTSNTTLNNVTFTGNSASTGGAMHNTGHLGTGNPSLINVVFSGNSAASGGGIYNDDVSPRMTNVTFSGNIAYSGGAIYSEGQESGSSPRLTNIILWGNIAQTSSGQMYNFYASPVISTSLVQGGLNGGGVYNENGSVTDGGGNLNADPDFVRDPDPGSGGWDGVDDDYGDLHLGAGSPAIDTGTNGAITLTVDLDGNPRVVDGDGNGTATVDMGAYEYNCPAGSILYVDHAASGTGSSWADAKPDLALGLDLVGEYCPNISQVWVATGIYTPGIYQSDSFNLPPGVVVYGGFDPTGGADEFSERDWEAHPTILSGDIAGDDTTTGGVVLAITDIAGVNSHHVVMADGTSTPITGATVLDGFTITAGQANGDSSSDRDGGGFYCDGSSGECSPSLTNVVFSGNDVDSRGAAMYNDGGEGESSPTLTNVTFSGNEAPDSNGAGGAMYNDGYLGTSSPTLKDVTFTGNSANNYGGAMYNRKSNPSLEKVTFSGNSSGYGGAMVNAHSSPDLENVTFSGNSANTAGAMYNIGTGGNSSPTLNWVTFSGNEAYQGGAMVNECDWGTSNPILTNVIFSGNSATYDGGAIYSTAGTGGRMSNAPGLDWVSFDQGCNPRLTNVTFSGNSAERGGAMFNYGEFGNVNSRLTNVAFSGNAADQGGAMFSLGSFSALSSHSLSNVILWGNTAVISGSQMYNEYAIVGFTTSLVHGGFTGSGIYNLDSTVYDGGGNLDADPDFLRDPDPGSDGNWDGVDDDYGDLHLKVSSPAIDTGTNEAITLTVDLDGNPREVDGDGDGTATVDMGAYEYNCPAWDILYVDHTSSGDGKSWAEAQPDLAKGLDMAGYCPGVSQVWVATGVYIPGTQRSDSFNLPPGVTVYGGFYPLGGADQFGERDWKTYPTILSGDIGGDDTTTGGVALATTDIAGGNSYHVVTADGTNTPITSNTILDGFTVTAGQANGESPDNLGGGFYCDGSSGGQCSPSLSNLTFSGNYAGTSGGAIYNNGYQGTSSPTLNHMIFSGNSAKYLGGAIVSSGKNGSSSPSLVNVTFSGNSVGDCGGAIYNTCEGGACNPSLTNVTFSGNDAYSGGAMCNYYFNNGTSSLSLVNLILWGNTATDGSQMYNSNAKVTFTTSLVQGGLFGDGIYNASGSTVINGGGNLDADPEFLRDPDPGSDGEWDGADDDFGDLHLGTGSPAIDTGTDSAVTLAVDLDGGPRKIDGDGDGTATVDMGAYEAPLFVILTVELAGSGGGTVTGTGINCFVGTGADCSEAYPEGSVVTLSASADPGSTFAGWGAPCSGKDNCQVTMNAPISVTATFTKDQDIDRNLLFLPLIVTR